MIKRCCGPHLPRSLCNRGIPSALAIGITRVSTAKDKGPRNKALIRNRRRAVSLSCVPIGSDEGGRGLLVGRAMTHAEDLMCAGRAWVMRPRVRSWRTVPSVTVLRAGGPVVSEVSLASLAESMV